MRKLKFDKLRPQIHVFRNDKNGRKFVNRKYVCTLCQSEFPSFRQYDVHSISHLCKKCLGLYAPHEKCEHEKKCKYVPQRGGNEVADAPLLPSNLELGEFILEDYVHMGTLATFTYKFKDKIENITAAINFKYRDIKRICTKLIDHWHGLKLAIDIDCILETIDGLTKKQRVLFGPFQRIVNVQSIDSKARIALTYLTTTLQVYSENASGWKLSKITKIILRCAQYTPITPAGYIETPSFVKAKHIINIKTSDCCFLYSILSILKRERIIQNLFPGFIECDLSASQRKKLNKLLTLPSTYIPIVNEILQSGEFQLDGFTGPVDIQNYLRFSELNDVSILLLAIDGTNYYPLICCEEIKAKHVDLLMLKEAVSSTEIGDPVNAIQFSYHVVAITNLTALICKPGWPRRSICTYCLKATKIPLANHHAMCAVLHKKRLSFPTHSHYKSFQLKSRLDIAYRIFFSVLCYREPVEQVEKTEEYDKLQYTTKEANLKMYAYCIAVVNEMDQLLILEYYDGPMCAESFITTLISLGENYENKVKTEPIPLIITNEDRFRYASTTACELCKLPFTPNRRKNFHHNHTNPNVRIEIWCTHCNLACRVTSHVLISFGNADIENHIILKSLRPELCKSISIVSQSSEKILTMTLNKIHRIIDLQYFLNTDLSDSVMKIRNNVCRDDFSTKFPHLFKMYGEFAYDLLTQRLWFPYKWFTHPCNLTQTQIPPRTFFKDDIYDDFISEEDYDFCKFIYSRFNCKSMKKYARTFLQSQVLLIADVATNFNKLCGAYLEWYPFHFCTSSGYSFHVSMQMSKAPYEFIKDIPAIEMLQDHLKGGINVVANRFAIANNEEIGNFNPLKDRKYIVHFDANSMYARCEYDALPHSEPYWLDESELLKFDLMSISKECEFGYFIYCDIQIPKEIHDWTDSLPLCPEKSLINEKWFSDIQKALFRNIQEDISNPFSKEKLVLTLFDKKNYFCYHELLQFFCSKGAIITHVHKILRMKRIPFLRPFAEKVTQLRNSAKLNNDQFSDSILKGWYCSVFGKCCQNRANYRDMRIAITRTQALNYIAKDNMVDYFIISKDIASFQFSRRTNYVSSPLAAGFAILDISKMHYYKFFYDLKQKFQDMIFLGGDTDSIIAVLSSKKKNDIWRKLKQLDNIDLSMLPFQHPGYLNKNMNVAGSFALRMHKIKECVFLKPRFVSLLAECRRCGKLSDGVCRFCLNLKRAKSIPRSVLLRLDHKFYLESLNKQNVQFVESRGLRSRKNEVGIYHVQRTGFYSLLTCRYLHEDLVTTTAYGNKNLSAIAD